MLFSNGPLFEQPEQEKKPQPTLSEALMKAGVTDDVKITLVPRARNLIQVRMQNLADLYDSSAKTAQFNIDAIGRALWSSANEMNDSKLASIKVEELSLTGNMPLKERLAKHMHWNTVADDLLAQD